MYWSVLNCILLCRSIHFCVITLFYFLHAFTSERYFWQSYFTMICGFVWNKTKYKQLQKREMIDVISPWNRTSWGNKALFAHAHATRKKKYASNPSPYLHAHTDFDRKKILYKEYFYACLCMFWKVYSRHTCIYKVKMNELSWQFKNI